MVTKKNIPKKTASIKSKDNEKMNELKIELLKQPIKRKQIKREIARLLTLRNKPTEDKKQ